MVFLSSIIILCVCLVYWRYSARIERQLLFSPVPTLLVSNSAYQSVDLKQEVADIPSVLIYFNSTCPICQSEAELIRKQFASDSLTHFLWVSSEKVEDVRLFSESFGLETLDTHTFYSDTLFTLASAFRLTGVPATMVYDSNGKLVKFFNGAVSTSDLKIAVQKAHDSTR